MTAGRSDRGPVRIRRRGRHTTPSQVEKVAQQAGKAAPAVAIAGALVAAPQATHALAGTAKPVTATVSSHETAAANGTEAGTRTPAATLDSVATRAVAVTAAKTAKHSAAAQSTYYSVRNGDTLSKIAERFYHNPSDWQYLYHENEKTLADPNQLKTGERLLLPATAPAHYTLSNYVPRHAAPAQKAGSTVSETRSSTKSVTTEAKSAVAATTARGTYSCSGLEELWDQAGGNPASAVMAAEIAMAESGGNPSAISPTADYGLWQINISNGALATLNPAQNAKSAIDLSRNGTSWGPWTTFRTGAYSGKC